ncbi:PREDICTED: LOB domain-containing protein 1-like [Ipomoea nil]|uniref:LOB domain-containing protein 1-like n=1 Tax=Ipomoea nil TaxID=35883 RepID=UPI000901A170|nr:PREDICTED: LOB domain-containing protein 1-like [Ipomoea nil]
MTLDGASQSLCHQDFFSYPYIYIYIEREREISVISPSLRHHPKRKIEEHYCNTDNNSNSGTTTPSSTAAVGGGATFPTSSAPPAAGVILSPCAACKILRRRCVERCVLAPYFPPTEPLKFTIAHRVFGASNIIKTLQELPEDRRADTVSSMVYKANARIRDPVYGCAGAVCQLEKQINAMRAELAKAEAEMLNLQCQNANLIAYVDWRLPPQHDDMSSHRNTAAFFSPEDANVCAARAGTPQL